MRRRWFILACAAPLVVWALRPQDSRTAAVPTIVFNRVWSSFSPQHVNITVLSTGSGKYISGDTAKEGEEAEPDFRLEFILSPATREKLFRWTKEANYFHGDFSFKKHVVASTGKKVLTYTDPTQHFDTTY